MNEEGKNDENQEIEVFVGNLFVGKEVDDEYKKRISDGLHNLLNNSEAEVRFPPCKFGDDGVRIVARYLKNNTACTALIFQHNEVTDSGCKALAEGLLHNTSLLELDLNGNQVADSGCEVLAEGLRHNNSLRKLSLWDNQIADVGCKVLADVLLVNTSLQELVLGKNQITDVGCKALADVLAKNMSLQTLRLSECRISTDGLLYFANMCKSNSRSFEALGFDRQTFQDGSTSKSAWMPGKLLTYTRELGNGHFGAAHLGQYLNKCVVMKTSHSTNSPEESFETIVLTVLPEHENVVTLIGKCDNADIGGQKRTALVLEAHEGGSLKSYTIKHKGKMPLSDIYSFAQQMTRAVQHLHKYKMIHRDFALRNYVLSGDFKKVILIDFGLAFVVEEDDKPFIARKNDALPFRSLPPEALFSPCPFYMSSDIWMLGVTFWQIFAKIKTPFKIYKSIADFKKLLLKKMVGRLKPIPLPFFSLVPPEMKQLIFDCCEFDHKRRPTATEVLDRLDKMVKNLTDEKVEETNSNAPDVQPGYVAPEEYSDIDDLSEAEVVSSEYACLSESEDESKDVDLSAYVKKLNVGEDEEKNEYIYFTEKVQDERNFNEILQIYRKRRGFPLEEDYQKENLDPESRQETSEENHNVSKEEPTPSEVVIAVEDLQTEFIQGDNQDVLIEAEAGVVGSTKSDAPVDDETENGKLLQDRDGFSKFNCWSYSCVIS